MKKTFTILIAAIAAILMMALPKMVVAQDPSASFTVTGLSSLPESFSSTPTGFTMSVQNNGGSNGPTVSSGSLRLYTSNEITIASTNGQTKIKSVTFNMTIAANSKQKYPGISAPSGSFDPSSVTTSTTTITWTASGNGVTTITFTLTPHTNGAGGNWTFSAVSLTYESGGGSTTYSVTYNANGGTGTMTDSNSPYAANATVTLLENTFTAPSGKVWGSWLVKDADQNAISLTNNDTQFTMPASNVTVTAQWVNAPTYTITAVSNNDTYGTVELNDNEITASPNSGYRISKTTPYSVTDGSATVVRDGNVFTVSPTSNCTVQINFEAIPQIEGYSIDFEEDLECYVDWEFSNIGIHTTGLTCGSHDSGGSAWGSNVNADDNATKTAIIKTKEKVTYPDVFTCYISKESSNSTSSTWKIQVWDGTTPETWIDIATTSSMTQNQWTSFTGNIKNAGYTNVYVRLYYDGTNAKRAVDDISLTTYTPAAVEAPTITVTSPFTFSTSVNMSCTTNGATIYYTTDGSTPTTSSTQYTGEFSINATTTFKAKAFKNSDESAVTEVTATKNLVTPTVAITPAEGFTNDLANGTNVAAGTLTASVTYNDAAVQGATVTWESTNTSVATVDESGAVTLIAKGATTIRASYAGNSDYYAANDEYDLTVVNTYDPGQSNNPYTVSQALSAELPATNIYVSGVISSITEVNTNQYYNATYLITDGENTMNVFRGKYLNNDNFTNANQIKVGDHVVIYGNLSKYNNANQLAQGNYIVSLKHTVTYHINNGSGTETQEILVDHGTAHTVIAKPDGWTNPDNTKLFVKWNTQNDGEGTDYAPDASLTVNANIDLYAVWADNVWTINYTTNNVPEETKTYVVKGQTISGLLAVPAQTVPAGYTFVGWSANDVTLTDDERTFVENGGTINDDMTLKAVFAIGRTEQTIQNKSLTLKSGDISWESGSGYRGGTATVDDISFTIENGLTSGDYIQLRKSDGKVYNTTALGDHITTITATVGVNSIVVYEGESQNPSSSEVSIEDGVYTFSGNTDYFAITSTNAYTQVYFTINYVKTSTETVYSDYCTSVKNAQQGITGGSINNNELTGTGTIAANTAVSITSLTIKKDAILIVNGVIATDNPANLIIEDGAQLILANGNDNVKATVKKSITAAVVPNSKAGEAPFGWYSISSSVNNAKIAGEGANTNLITASGYDLYRYNETVSAKQWENYHASNTEPFTNMTNGRGYLYRNANNVTIEFTGTVNTGDVKYTVTKSDVGALSGFNLIGNPYTHDIYKGTGGAIDDSKLNEGFYVATNSGSWTACTDNTTPIEKNQGILVQANNGGVIPMTNTTNGYIDPNAKANHDNIKFMVANSQYEDVAYAMFDKGNGLNKISHRNAEIPMLYIPQNDENYAIAMMSDDTQSFGLNFKAMTMGKYTLSYKANGQFSYLHVIDRLTGEDVDMLLEESYSFVGTPKDAENRFIVKLNYQSGLDSSDNSTFAYQSGNDIIVSGEGTLQIFDVMGRMIATQNINGVETVNVPANGVYVFRLNEKVQKVVVK